MSDRSYNVNGGRYWADGEWHDGPIPNPVVAQKSDSLGKTGQFWSDGKWQDEPAPVKTPTRRPTKPRQPAWAAAGSFAAAWSSISTSALAESDFHPLIPEGGLLHYMADAKVLTINAEQVAALSGIEWEGQTPRAPFDVTYIDMGRAKVGSSRMDILDTGVYLAGVLIQQFDEKDPLGDGLAITSFVGSSGSGLGHLPMVFVDSGGKRDFRGQKEKQSALHGDYVAERMEDIVDAVLNVLAWMESVNVEIVETPMKPRVKEREEAKGRKISLVVQVKKGKRRTSVARGGEAHYSHQFEIRGHYKHHFPEKPDGEANKVFERYARLHPEKVLTIQGQPCVRFWTPPFIKGPVDKPLVPKIRVVQETA